jgi:hypothetical protein
MNKDVKGGGVDGSGIDVSVSGIQKMDTSGALVGGGGAEGGGVGGAW